jgi:hypothetical protein
MNELKVNDKLLSYKDLSARWQIPIQTLRIWVMAKKLKPLKLCRQVRFPLSYIRAIEEAGGFN